MTEDPDVEPQYLWTWLKDIEPRTQPLAWCHTTTAYLFREMVRCGMCSIELCKYSAEELLYFFYGRAAYRLADEPMKKSSSLPVVLLFDPALVESGKRLFPFDSGAFRTKLIDRWLDPGMKLAHFALECGIDPVRRFVSAFYESNDHYLRTRVRTDIKNDIKRYGGHFEVSALLNILQAAGLGEFDDRVGAVELQLATSVLLGPNYLKAVIYPDELEQADWFTSFLAGLEREVKWDRYEPHFSKQISEYQGHLEERARAIQISLGYV